MSILTLEQLLAQPDADALTEKVDLTPYGWPGTVRIRALSLEARDRIREACTAGREFDQVRFDTLILVEGLVEPRLTEEQVRALRTKAVGPQQAIINRIQDLSGITPRGQTDARAVADDEAAFREG